MTELEKLHMDDLKADLSSAIEKYGAREVLMSFKESYPNHYTELFVQMTRNLKTRTVPALLVKRDAPPM